MWLMRGRSALLSLTASGLLLALAACTVGPNWEPMIKQAPHAYTGPCQTTRAGGRWLQPQINHLSTQPIPTPCYNLAGSVGTYVEPSPQAGQHYIDVTEWRGGGGEETDKLWVKVEPRPAGAWLISWGAKPGVRVEWLLAAANAFPAFLPAHTGHFLWRPFPGAQDYPEFSLYANDLDVSAKTPVTITPTPQPHP